MNIDEICVAKGWKINLEIENITFPLFVFSDHGSSLASIEYTDKDKDVSYVWNVPLKELDSIEKIIKVIENTLREDLLNKRNDIDKKLFNRQEEVKWRQKKFN